MGTTYDAKVATVTPDDLADHVRGAGRGRRDPPAAGARPDHRRVDRDVGQVLADLDR